MRLAIPISQLGARWRQGDGRVIASDEQKLKGCRSLEPTFLLEKTIVFAQLARGAAPSYARGVARTFTKADLRSLYAMLTRLLPPGQLPTRPEDVVEVGRLRDLTSEVIRDLAPVMERGEKVLEWRIPREQAPRLNEYAYMKIWQKNRLRKELDDQLCKLKRKWKKADLNGAQKRRWLRVTRFSTMKIDDVSVDVLGGKMPVDSLVRCGVLVDDNIAFTHREALWEKTARGNTHVLVEVFEMRIEGEQHEEPTDGLVSQVIRVEGSLTRAIKGT